MTAPPLLRQIPPCHPPPAATSHSMHEFTIDFVRMNGSMPMGGVVVQRINISPLLAQQLIEALQQNHAAKAMPPEIESS